MKKANTAAAVQQEGPPAANNIAELSFAVCFIANAIKNPEAFGLGVDVFRAKSNRPSRPPVELIITMLPTMPVMTTGGLANVISIGGLTNSSRNEVRFMQG